MTNKKIMYQGDSNALAGYGDYIPLRNEDTIKRMRKYMGENLIGEQVWLYEMTKNNKGESDPTLYSGVIEMLDQEMIIRVDINSMIYLSESEFNEQELEMV